MNIKDDFKIDFIGIGAEKSGTTWLSDMLSAHSEICISEPKEIRYYNEKYSFFRKEEPSNFKKHSFQWYKNHFSHCNNGQLKGELSPIYFFDKEAPERIAKHFPDIKLILILRNPIDKTYSLYWMCKEYLSVENRSFEKALKEEPEYIEKGMYSKQLERYLEYFNLDQIKIIFLEEVKKDPKKQLREVFRFLGVQDAQFIPGDIHKRSNYGKKTKVKFIILFMNKISIFLNEIGANSVLRFLKKIGLKKVALMIATKKLKCPPMNPKTRTYLKNVFEGDINNFGKLINRDITFWKND